MYKGIITIEEGTVIGGLGSSVLAFANRHNYKQPIITKGITDAFVEHGTVDELKALQKLDINSLKIELEQLLFTINNS